MPRLEEVFNTAELINYYKERTLEPMLGESLFPERKIQDIEFDMILGGGGLPVSASVHALDTATQLASREAIQRGVAALALIKRQIKITEKVNDYMYVFQPVSFHGSGICAGGRKRQL